MGVSAFASGFGGITVLMQWGMVGEAIDYNEYVTGKRTEGSIYGTFNLMRRIGQALGCLLYTSILHGYQLKGAVHGNQLTGNGKNHQVGLHLGRRKVMRPQRGSSGALPVKHAVIDFIGIDTFLQLFHQDFPRHVKRDFQHFAAVVKTIHMILYRKNVIMGKGSGIVAAIAKINGPVQHGDFHFFQWPDFSIVISYIFHIKVLLICNS